MNRLANKEVLIMAGFPLIKQNTSIREAHHTWAKQVMVKSSKKGNLGRTKPSGRVVLRTGPPGFCNCTHRKALQDFHRRVSFLGSGTPKRVVLLVSL